MLREGLLEIGIHPRTLNTATRYGKIAAAAAFFIAAYGAWEYNNMPPSFNGFNSIDTNKLSKAIENMDTDEARKFVRDSYKTLYTKINNRYMTYENPENSAYITKHNAKLRSLYRDYNTKATNGLIRMKMIMTKTCKKKGKCAKHVWEDTVE
jgi:hypothetical protein